MSELVVHDRRHTAVRETRDPSVATQPRTFVTPNMPMEPQWNAQTAIERGLYANVFVYRCVQVTAQAISAMPIRVGADPDKPQDYRKDGTFARMFSPPPGGPNKTTSAKKFVAWLVSQRMVCGRYAWEYDFDSQGRIVGAWPLPAPRLKPNPSKNGDRYFESYTWTDTSGQWRNLAADEVFYAWQPSADDWREPQSALQAARLDVSQHIMQNRYDYAFLRNGGIPAAMVVGPLISASDEREAFERQFSAYKGVDQAGKTAFAYTEAGSPLDSNGNRIPPWDVKVLGLSQRDTQALERQRDVADRICAAFGTPMSKIGDSSGRTFSNAAQEDQNWYRESVIPDAQDIADEINLIMAPRLGSDVCWFDTTKIDALQPGKQWTPVPITDLFDRGIAGADWVADEVGIPRGEMGQVIAPNTAAVAQKELAQSGAGPAPKRDTIDLTQTDPTLAAGREDLDEQWLAGKEITPGDVAGTERLHKYWTAGPGLAKWVDSPHPWTALYHHLLKYIKDPDFAKRTAAKWFHEVKGIWPGTPHAKNPGEIFEARRTQAWHDVDTRTTALEALWEAELRDMFAKQRDATLARLEGKRGKQALRAVNDQASPDAATIFTQDHWQTETTKTASGLYRAIAAVAGPTVADKLGQTFGMHSPQIVAFIRNRANKLAGYVTKTTYDNIHDALVEGVNAGEGIPQLAGRVRHVFQIASDTRAKTIARTEVISAYNGASEAVVASYGPDVVGGKEWIATRDTRTREHHREADGQTVATHEHFTVGGTPMAYPGDPIAPASEVVNCRCTLGYLTPQDMADRGHRIFSTQLQPHEARALFHLIHGGRDDAAVS